MFILITGWLTGLGFSCLTVSQKEQALEKALKHPVALIKLLFTVLIFKVQKTGWAIPTDELERRRGCYLKPFTKTRMSQTPSDSSQRKWRTVSTYSKAWGEEEGHIFTQSICSLVITQHPPSEHLCMSPRHSDAFNTQGRSSLAPATLAWCLMLYQKAGETPKLFKLRPPYIFLVFSYYENAILKKNTNRHTSMDGGKIMRSQP